MKTVLEKMETFCEWFVGLCIFVIVAAMSLQVFCRYVLVRPLIWAEELSKFAFIWSVFFGAFVGVRKKMHVSIDTLVNVFPPLLKKTVMILVNFSIIGILASGAYFGFTLYGFSLTSKLPAINIPLGYIYIPLAISFSLMILSHVDMIIDILAADRSGKK